MDPTRNPDHTLDESDDECRALIVPPRGEGQRREMRITRRAEHCTAAATSFGAHSSAAAARPAKSTAASARPAAASVPPHPFRQVVHWQLQDLGMLLGADQVVFSSADHPAMALQLVDLRRPIRPLSILEFWLDNVMAAISLLQPPLSL